MSVLYYQFSSFHFNHLHRLNLAGVKWVPLVGHFAKVYLLQIYTADVHVVGGVVVDFPVGEVY